MPGTPTPVTPTAAAHTPGQIGAHPVAMSVASNPHPVTLRAAMLPVVPAGGLHRPLPHFVLVGATAQPPVPIALEFYRPAAPFTRGMVFSAPPRPHGTLLFGTAIAAPVNPDPMTLVQYDSVAVASGNDVRQAYVTEVGSPPSSLQLVGFTVGASRPVIDRSSNDFMMIKDTGVVVVPAGTQAIAKEHLLLYPPGTDQPLQKDKPLSLDPDGGQFEDQFSFPISADSPQGDYKYTVQMVVNDQVMGEQSGVFQAL
jgi:hypothetical protein